VVVIGDGQVTQGKSTVYKPNARKVRIIGNGKVICGFAGSTADCFALLEALEKKLEEFPGQLMRAAVELAKMWRTDKYLKQLEVRQQDARKKRRASASGTPATRQVPQRHAAAYFTTLCCRPVCVDRPR